MADLIDAFAAINGVLWHEYVLFFLLATGLLFSVWSKFGQVRALTHGGSLILGHYDRAGAPGAITHFQALSAALSATVGLGNIGGVAVAVALGGPGAVFWMWVVGFVGMALKMTEVTLSMLYRRTDDPDNPHGGPMWVVSQGLAQHGRRWGLVGKAIGVVFCVTLLVSTITGGNMFQAWNVGIVGEKNFGIPQFVSGLALAALVALVIIGGIKRIGRVAERIVPSMCGLYLIGALIVVVVKRDEVPRVFGLIFAGAFGPLAPQGAFVGGSFAIALSWGMKRAFFSNEAGQGSSPIAHSAARTDEPVSEGIVAGLEPFIDTLVVCSLTAFVILLSGVWNRPAAATLAAPPAFVAQEGGWALPPTVLPPRVDGQAWPQGEGVVFVVADGAGGDRRQGVGTKVVGSVHVREGDSVAEWGLVVAATEPHLRDGGAYLEYPGAALTSFAFDNVIAGFGRWVVTIAVWLFALSTMISWSYYGEQGIVYLLGVRAVLPYKVVYCAAAVLACSGLIRDDAALDEVSSLGTGLMLFANIPILLLFGRQTMRAYRQYVARLRRGEIKRLR